MNFLVKIKEIVFKYKKTSIIIILFLLGGGYFWYQPIASNSGTNKYVLAEVAKATIVSSISGTGQVSASSQLDIKPQVSGNLVYVNITKNMSVKAGTLLAQVESRDAQMVMQSAQNDLASAQLSSQDISGTARDALDASYSSGLDSLTNTFNDLTSMKASLDAIFLQSSYKGSDSDMSYYLNFVKYYDSSSSSELSYWTTDAKQKYNDLQSKLDSIEEVAWTLNKNSPSSQIENAINQSYTANNNFLDLIRQASNLIQRYQKILLTQSLTTPISVSTTTSQATQLSSALALLVKDVTALSTAKTNITTQKQTYSKVGVNTQAQNLNILQYQNALADAKDALAKYYVYAPMDGIISSTDSTTKVGDAVSSGTVLGSMIANQNIIQLSLNEVDVVKVKTGEKVAITFDALPDITATGYVADVDTVGTVSQGVVSYGVKIALDITDSKIKPGMSASVNIITDTRQNVLTVPNSAVKSKNGNYYVFVLNQKQDLTSPTASQGFASPIAPTQKTVEIGLADESNTEIISGLAEGDQVVLRTISSTTTATSTGRAGTTSATRLITGGGAGGGFTGGRPGN